jgi:hypothetical protein
MRLHLAVLAALLPLAACTTLQPLADAQPATIRQAVESGDRVELELADGTRQTLTVDSVSDTEIVGRTGGKRRAVPLASIRSVAVREMTTQDKVWTGLGVVAVIGAIAAVAGGGGGGGDGGSGY